MVTLSGYVYSAQFVAPTDSVVVDWLITPTAILRCSTLRSRVAEPFTDWTFLWWRKAVTRSADWPFDAMALNDELTQHGALEIALWLDTFRDKTQAVAAQTAEAMSATTTVQQLAAYCLALKAREGRHYG